MPGFCSVFCMSGDILNPPGLQVPAARQRAGHPKTRMTTSQSASPVRKDEVKRGRPQLEPKAPLTVADKPRPERSGFSTSQPPPKKPCALSRHSRCFAVDRKLALLFGMLLILAFVNAVLVHNVLWNHQDVSDVRALVNRMGSISQQTALQALGIVLGGEGGRARVRAGLGEIDMTLDALREGGRIDGLTVLPLPAVLQPSLHAIRIQRDILLARVAPVLQEPGPHMADTQQDVLQWHEDLLGDVNEFWRACRVLVRGLVAQRMRSQQRMLWRMYGLLLFDALVLLGAYGWMRYTLTQPLRALAEGWRKLAQGDYQVRMKKTAFAEINEVTQAFNESVERISSLLKHTEEHLWRQANYDELTGLANRYMFRHRVVNEIGRAQRREISMAVLFLDLNLFKQVNDTYGHESGDRLLQQVGKRLTGCVREVDMVARLGGDEFTIVLSELGDRAVVERICADIHATLAAPFDLGKVTVRISCSIGVALYPENGTCLEDLLHHADMAMYQAKRARAGKDAVCEDGDDARQSAAPANRRA